MIAEVARMLKENKVKLPFGVYFTNSVQEEIGLRGAEMIAHRINPDVAIVTDVCHDTQTPMMSKIMSGDISCGKGPVLSYGPAVQNNGIIADSLGHSPFLPCRAEQYQLGVAGVGSGGGLPVRFATSSSRMISGPITYLAVHEKTGQFAGFFRHSVCGCDLMQLADRLHRLLIHRSLMSSNRSRYSSQAYLAQCLLWCQAGKSDMECHLRWRRRWQNVQSARNRKDWVRFLLLSGKRKFRKWLMI
jgi:hypothetical protein